MAYNLFLDSDVLLDIILDRPPFAEQSLELFIHRTNETIQLFTSSSIIINTQYIGEKQIGVSLTKTGMKKLLQYLEIINPARQTILEAYNSPFKDVEDAVQYYTAAEHDKIDFFITRNTKDFKMAEAHLPVLTPTQFLKRI